MTIKSLANTRFMICIALIAGFASPIIAVNRNTAPTQHEKECPICLDELASRATIHLDCGEKVPHSYCLDCFGSLIAAGEPCSLCRKPFDEISVYNPCIKSGDYKRIRGLDRELTEAEQKLLEAFLECFPHSKKPFPENGTGTKKTPTSSTPRPGQKDGKPHDDLGDLTPEERRFMDIPIAPAKFPPIPLTEEDIKLNAELPRHLDRKVWQVIIAEDGTHMRARRAVPLTSWPDESETADSKRLSWGAYFKDVARDIAAGTVFGFLIGPEVESEKTWPKIVKADGSEEPNPEKESYETHLNRRRMLYGPALMLGYAVLKEAHPDRPLSVKAVLPWGAGIALGIGLHFLIGT